MASFSFGGHDRSIWVGRTDHEVSHAPIGAPNVLPVRFSSLLDPVMTLLICLGQVLTESSFNENRKWDRSRDSGFTDGGGRHWCLAGWSCLFMDRCRLTHKFAKKGIYASETGVGACNACPGPV